MTPSTLLLRSSNPGALLIWCGIGFCGGLYLFVQGFRLLQRRQLILNTPVSKIRSASLGMVEVSGLAVGPYTMVAPITERACYYYRTVAWEWKHQGKSSSWVKVAAECLHVPFFLDDNTGKVMVDPRGADLDLHRDFEQEFCDSFFSMKQDAPENVRSFLQRHGVSTTNKIKVEEFCIKPKNALFLLGTLTENPGLELAAEPIHDAELLSPFAADSVSLSLGGAAISLMRSGAAISPVDVVPLGETIVGGHSLRESGFDKSDLYRTGFSRPHAADQVIQLTPTPVPIKAAEMSQQQKIAAAMMKAGISNPAAWAAAGVAPSQADVSGSNVPLQSGAANTGTSNAAIEGFDARPPVVLMKGKNNPTLLISWRSQRELANSLGWKCALMIWGGPVLALLSLYGLSSITHWF